MTLPRRVLSVTMMLCVLGPVALGQTINALTDTTPGLSQSLAEAGTGQFTLTVNGSGFTSTGVVRLGSTDLTTTFVSATQMTAVVPASLVKTIGTLAVTVVDGSNTSNSVDLKVAARGDANAGGTVNIGDALVIARSVGGLVSPGVPSSLGDVNLSGSINIGDALVVALYAGGINTNLATPVITGTSATAPVSPGDTITITGTGMKSTTAADYSVVVTNTGGNVSQVTPTAADGTTLTVTLPSDVASGPIFVKRVDLGLPGQPHVLEVASSTVPLYISKVNPFVSLVAGSTAITLTGSGFTSATLTDYTVTFLSSGGTVTANPTAVSSTSMTVTVPTGAVSGSVTVTLSSTTSNAKSVLVSGTTTPLQINQVYYPDQVGESILIEGTGFDEGKPGDNRVVFVDSQGADVIGTVAVAGRTELIVLVPTGATTGNLKVERTDLTTTSNTVTYTAATGGGPTAAATVDSIDVIVASGATAIGAYQAKINFDPNVVFVDVLNVEGGQTSGSTNPGDGFTGTPLSINVDNVSGSVTINAFQVGNSPTGTFTVARIGFSAVAAGSSALTVDLTSSVLTNTAGTDLTFANPTPTISLSASTITVATNQIATISSLSPANVAQGASGFTLTVNGQKFARGATIKFGSTDVTTTFTNGRVLKGTIASTLVTSSGTVNVTVVNPTPGGGTSSASTFNVNNPLPRVTSISPTTSTSGTTSLTLTVTGTDFTSSSTVQVAGTSWTTTFVSATQVTAVIPANTTLTGGVFGVTVVNPTPGGGTSNRKSLTVTGGSGLTANLIINSPSQPVGAYQVTIGFDPKIVTVAAVSGGTATGFTGNPATVNADNTAGTLVLNHFQTTASPTGSSLKVAEITFSPVKPGTSVLSITTNSLTDVQGSDITSSASAALSVTSVQVEGTTTPEIVSIDPASAAAGSSAQVRITIEGTDLTTDLFGTFNGNRVGTVFDSATRVTVTIPASQLTVPGRFQVQLTDGSSAVSNPVDFVVTDPVEAPAIASISPATGVQSTTVEATITGTNLTGASEITFSGSDVTGTIGSGGSATSVPVRITVGAGAATGSRTMTLTARGGQIRTTRVVFGITAAVGVAALTATPTTLELSEGATSSPVTVSIGTAVTVATTVGIATSNAQIATAPAAVTVAAGQSSTTFLVRAKTAGEATLTLSARGFASAAANVTVTRAVSTAPIVESVSPTTRANTAGTFTLTITGEKLQRASSIAFLAPGATGPVTDTTLTAAGISVNSDGTSLTAAVTVASGARPGPRVVTVTVPDLTDPVRNTVLATGGTSRARPSSANTLELTGTDTRPTITGITPNTGVPGQRLTATIAGTNLTGASVTVIDLALGEVDSAVGVGTTVTVTSGATRASVVFTIDRDAFAGPRVIVVTTTNGSSDFTATPANRFEITGATADIPVITAMSPATGNANTTGTAFVITGVNLTGATSLEFLAADPTGSVLDTKITTGTLSVSPAGTEIRTTIDIASDAVPGPRVVVVNADSGASNATPGPANTFSVAGTAAVPSISGLTPASGSPGQTFATFGMTGTSLDGSSPQIVFLRPSPGGPIVDPDITVTGITATATAATGNLVIAVTAPPGPRLVVIAAGGITSSTQPTDNNVFEVQIGGASQPTITDITPKFGEAGGSVSVVVTGTNLTSGTLQFLKLQPGGPVADTDLTITNVVNSSATQLTADLALGANASEGPRVAIISTTNGSTGGQPSEANVFFVGAGFQREVLPEVTGITPDSGFLNETVTGFTVNGVNLTNATSLRFLIPSPGGPVNDRFISIANFNVVNDTQITANVTIDPLALGGPHIVQVVAGQKQSSDFPGPNLFFVDIFGTIGEPIIDFPEPGDASPGQTFQLKLNGVSFTGMTKLKMLRPTPTGPAADTNFTIGTFTVVNDNQITVDLTIGANAEIGPRIMQVLNADETSKSSDFPTFGNEFFVRPGGAITGPEIDFVQPPIMRAGQSNIAFGVQGINLKGAATPTIAFRSVTNGTTVSGSASTSFTVTNVSVDPIGSRVTATVAVAADVPTGDYMTVVTVDSATTATDLSDPRSFGSVVFVESATGPAQRPRITNLSIRGFVPGETRQLTVTGENFTGATALEVFQLGPFGPETDPDTRVTNFTVGSATQITATLTIGPDAGPGPRILVVSTPTLRSDDIPTPDNTIDVAGGFFGTGGTFPDVTAISSSQGRVGETLTGFTLTGSNLTGTDTILFFAPGPFGGPPGPDPNIAVSGITASGTAVTATIVIEPGAFEGPHLVVVQTPTGVSDIFPDPNRIFSVVTSAVSGSVPVITSVSPGGAARGDTINPFTINGAKLTGTADLVFLVPLPGGPQVDTAVTAGALTVNSDGTQVTTTVNVAAGAIPGPHIVVVATPNGPSTDHPTPGNVFAVDSFSFGTGGPTFAPPDITSVRPGQITAGETNVTITIAGSSLPVSGGEIAFLQLGQTGPIPDSSITIDSFTVAGDGNSATAVIDVAPGVLSGPRVMVVFGPSGGSAPVPTPFNTIQINGGTSGGTSFPEVRRLNPNSDNGKTLDSAFQVTISGSNLTGVTDIGFLIPTPAGPQPDANVTATVVSATTTEVVANVTVATGAGNGPHFVVVKTATDRSLDFPTPDNTFMVTLGSSGFSGGFGLTNPPQVTSVTSSPATVNPGDTSVTVNVVGTNIENAVDVIFFSPSPGGPVPDINIDITGFTVTGDASSATVGLTINVGSFAPTGPRAVVVVTPFGPTFNDFTDATKLQIGSSSGGPTNFANLPTIDFVEPFSAIQGQTFSLQIFGRNLTGATGLTFVQPTPTGPVADAAITATNIVVDSTGTLVTADVTVGASSVSGPRFVFVRTPNGDAGNPPTPDSTLDIGFNTHFGFDSTGGPTISGISPTGTTAGDPEFTLRVDGSGFTGAFGVDFFLPTPTGPVPDPFVGTQNFTVVNDGQVTVDVTIPATAAGGPRFVVVATPNGPAGIPPDQENTLNVQGGVDITGGDGSAPFIDFADPQFVPAGSIVNNFILFGVNLQGTSQIEFFEFGSQQADTNFTVSSIVASGDGTTVNATVAITGRANPGPRIVVATATGGTTPNIPGGNVVNVVGNSNGPNVEAISPTTATPGQPVTLTIRGQNLCADSSCTVAPEILFLRAASGGPVEDSTIVATITSATADQVTAIVNLPATVTDPPFRIVVVRTTAGKSQDGPNPGNTLNLGTRTNAPTITAVATNPDPPVPGTVTLTLTGTNLQGGAPQFFIPSPNGAPQRDHSLFGQVTSSSGTQIVATVEIPTNATGKRLIIVSTPNGDNFGQDTPQFLTITNAAAPSMTGISPSTHGADDTGFTFTVTGTNLGSVTGLAFLIPGITPFEDPDIFPVVTAATSTSVTANVTIFSPAQSGPRGVLLFVGNAAVLLEPTPATTFFVVGGTDATAPFIFNASPTFLIKGQRQTINLTGDNLGGARVKFFTLPDSQNPNGAQDTSITSTVDPTKSSSAIVTATVEVPATATEGPRIVVVETLSGNNLGQPPVIVNIGSIATGGTNPQIQSVAPATASAGDTLDVVITGANFTGVDGGGVFIPTPFGPQFDPDFAINSVTINSATQITVNVTIASIAPEGPRFVIVRNGTSGERSEDFPNPGNEFFVGARGGTGGGNLPSITSLGPANHAADGAAFAFQISGSNLSTMDTIKFAVEGNDGLPAEDSNITVTDVAFNAGTNQLTANVTIATTATDGPRVVVARDSNTGLSTPIFPNPTFSNVFEIGSGAGGANEATITSMSPLTHDPDGVQFFFQINGTNLDQAAFFEFITIGPNPQPNFDVFYDNVTITPTQITAFVTIPSSAATGLHHLVLFRQNGSPAGFQPPTQGVNTFTIGGAVGGSGTLTLTKTNGDAQSGPEFQPLPIPLEVVAEVDGSAVAGLGISFSVASGDGFVQPAFATTDANGKAQAFASLGSAASQSFTATANGVSVTFTATIGSAQTGPIVTSVTPDNGPQGGSRNITITGNNLAAVSNVQFFTGNDPQTAVQDTAITVSNLSVTANQITATVNIGSAAQTGGHTIVLISGGQGFPAPAIFQVNASGGGGGSGGFGVASMSPDNGDVGTSVSVVINGSGLEGVTGVDFDPTPSGIVVSSFAASSSQITATLTISSSATPGGRSLILSTSQGPFNTGINFQVNAAGGGGGGGGGGSAGLTVTSIDRFAVNQGTTGVPITVQGTSLGSVTGIKFQSQGADDGNLTTTGFGATANQLTATLNIASLTPVGMRQLVLQTGSGDVVTSLFFEVNGFDQDFPNETLLVNVLAGLAIATDGENANAQALYTITGIAVDPSGNTYVSSATRNKVFLISSTGVLSTFAGTGAGGFAGDGGPADAARLFNPFGLALDNTGNLFIADKNNNRIRRVDSTSGLITTVAGNGAAGFGGDAGQATSAQLNAPEAVAVDPSGNLFIADSDNNRVRRVSAGTITTVAGTGTSTPGTADGTAATAAAIGRVEGVVLDGLGNLFLSDTTQDRVWRVAASDQTISTFAGGGAGAPTGAVATSVLLVDPAGLSGDGSGNLLIAERGNSDVLRVSGANITRIAGTTTNGFNGDGGAAAAAVLSEPRAIAVDAAGNILIADTGNERIRRVASSDQNISSIAGVGPQDGFSGDGGQGLSARLRGPQGLVRTANGDFYIADTINNRIRKLTAQGIITTFAAVTSPQGMDVDGSGNLYVATGPTVEKVAPNGTVTRFAGTAGVNGFAGDGGQATSAQLNLAEDVSVDTAGTVYIADTANHRIRQVAGSGVITTAAGTGVAGFSGDGGQATAAQLNLPRGIDVDGPGQLVIADTGNFRIREVGDVTAGVITSPAGNGVDAFGGDGGLATAASIVPIRVRLSPDGEIAYIVEASRVRLVFDAAEGGPTVITTLAGVGFPGVAQNGASALATSIGAPGALAAGNEGFFVASSNNRVYEVTTSGGGTQPPTLTGLNPNSGITTTQPVITLTGTNFVPGQTVVTLSSTGSTVGSSVTVTGTTTATVTLNLGSQPETFGITVSTGAGTSGSVNFNVTSGGGSQAPTLTGLNPNSGITTTQPVITLTGTNFVSGQTVVTLSSTGSTVGSSVTVTGTTTATVTLNLGSQPETFGITVSTGAGTSGSVNFNVTSGGGSQAPTLTGLNPNSGITTTQPVITLTGTNFVSGQTVVTLSSTGSTVGSLVTVTGTTTATVTLNLGSQPETFGITVSTGAGTSGSVNFNVTSGGGSQTPTLQSISPNSGGTGTQVNITLTGTNFVQGQTAVTVAGTGVTLGSAVVVNGTTSLTTSFIIAGNAATTPRGVTVSTSGGTSGSLNFNVTSVSTVTGINPGSGGTGNANLAVTITGSGLTGVTDVKFEFNNTADPNLTVNNFSGTDSQITFILDIQTATPLGTRNVKLITPAGEVQTGQTFDVFFQSAGLTPAVFAVNAGAVTTGIDIVVPSATPTLNVRGIDAFDVGATTSGAVSISAGLPRGQTKQVVVVGSGMTAVNGSTLAVSGTGTSISNLVFLTNSTSTSMQVDVVVDSNATLGPRNLIVQNSNDEISILTGGVFVQ